MTKYTLILESLRYKTMHERELAIPKAHAKTCERALSSPPMANGQMEPGDFYGWLKQGDGFFWVNGKAGSGKSTLIKNFW